MRRPEEVFVVVHRPGPHEREFLVLERAPDRQGYWHLVSGALEPGEGPPEAARRELAEEVGLAAAVEDLEREYVYSLADEPPVVRARFAPDVTRITVTSFAAEAPPGWEPTLDEEHVDYRWCTAAEAASLLHYPEPQDAVARAEERLGVA
ncbi:MAG TPA: NUDIX domain-containing protein [Gaiellaceae bacterium]|nr:NUDIX domain-containing protein [Gaiellaceae bacterium]